jgi:hypothetical protein
VLCKGLLRELARAASAFEQRDLNALLLLETNRHRVRGSGRERERERERERRPPVVPRARLVAMPLAEVAKTEPPAEVARTEGRSRHH